MAISHGQALIDGAIDRLTGRFAGLVVQRLVYESPAELQGARITTYVPLLTERFAAALAGARPMP